MKSQSFPWPTNGEFSDSVGFPGGASGKEPTCQCKRQEIRVRALGGEDSPGGGHGHPLQNSCLENPHGQRSLAGSQSVRHDRSDLSVHRKLGREGVFWLWPRKGARSQRQLVLDSKGACAIPALTGGLLSCRLLCEQPGVDPEPLSAGA